MYFPSLRSKISIMTPVISVHAFSKVKLTFYDKNVFSSDI